MEVFNIYNIYIVYKINKITYTKDTNKSFSGHLSLRWPLTADVGCPVLYPCLLLLYLHGLKTRAKLYA